MLTDSKYIDKDDLLSKVANVYLLLNGKTLDGQKATYGSYFTTIRYAIILLAAVTLNILKEEDESPRDCRRFNFYGLNKVAEALNLEFDRTKVAKKFIQN
jgi:hypothetical protein